MNRKLVTLMLSLRACTPARPDTEVPKDIGDSVGRKALP